MYSPIIQKLSFFFNHTETNTFEKNHLEESDQKLPNLEGSSSSAILKRGNK